MPVSYQIDKARRLVTSTASGFLTAADILAHQRKLLADTDFDPTCSQIVNCTAVTGINLSAEEVRAVASTAIFSAHSRRAVVVSTDEQFGFARLFKMLREAEGEYGIQVFRDPAEALRWAIPDDHAFSKTA
ncbi:MAG TPA: hypothetical protein VGT24_02790 [Candidatus Acidoferrales bacterium]|nr:hypothetical protein [Candidatus Acidoferrales bacterium]